MRHRTARDVGPVAGATWPVPRCPMSPARALATARSAPARRNAPRLPPENPRPTLTTSDKQRPPVGHVSAAHCKGMMSNDKLKIVTVGCQLLSLLCNICRTPRAGHLLVMTVPGWLSPGHFRRGYSRPSWTRRSIGRGGRRRGRGASVRSCGWLLSATGSRRFKLSSAQACRHDEAGNRWAAPLGKNR